MHGAVCWFCSAPCVTASAMCPVWSHLFCQKRWSHSWQSWHRMMAALVLWMEFNIFSFKYESRNLLGLKSKKQICSRKFKKNKILIEKYSYFCHQKKRETEDNVVQEFKNKLSAGKSERAKVLAKIHNFVKRLQHLLKQAPLRLDFVESSEK